MKALWLPRRDMLVWSEVKDFKRVVIGAVVRACPPRAAAHGRSIAAAAMHATMMASVDGREGEAERERAHPH